MRDHTKLRAFELADDLVLVVYRLTRGFPREEGYGLTAQMRRAAVSVPSNIVEGCARESQKDYLRFLEIAYSSLRELRYQLNLSHRLGYLDQEQHQLSETKSQETDKVLGALLRSLRPDRRVKEADETYSAIPDSLTA